MEPEGIIEPSDAVVVGNRSASEGLKSRANGVATSASLVAPDVQHRNRQLSALVVNIVTGAKLSETTQRWTSLTRLTMNGS